MSAVLQLALKGEYFDQIKAGDKPYEFRLITDFWSKRLVGRDYDDILLTRGYPSRAYLSRQLRRRWRGYTVETITHPHFGVDPVKVFAIDVSEPVSNTSKP